LPKTLAEIAIDAGLVTKANAAKAGKMAEERKQPLVVMLVRELGVDELALVTAFGKQTRVPLIDPGDVQIDPDALRSLSRDVCARLRILPLSLATDGATKIMRIAMADPTDTTAVAELESMTQCEIEVSALPLSAIDELIAKGYTHLNTGVINRPGNATVGAPVTGRGKKPDSAAPETNSNYTDSEVSVTAQIPLSLLQAPDDLETRLAALVQLLVGKGVITDAELTEVLVRLKSSGS
jgi:Type II secretion system (T2SS), protein E, N-terminal domain